MESRKIQKSGTTYYLYLPASWCREHNINTDSVVFLDKSSKGDLQIKPKKTEKNLSSLKIELDDNSTEVINKIIIASYINPVKEFQITLKEPISPDQILAHKQLLGGLELVDFDENFIVCHTSLALSDPDTLLKAMITKILSITKLMKKDITHELINKYEQEIDKSNLLIHKAIIASLMYRRESKLKHIELFYLGLISRHLEQLTDILITLDNDKVLISTIEAMMQDLQELLGNLNQQGVISFIKKLENLETIEVKDLQTYKTKRAYQILGHISEVLCDWVSTNLVDK